MNKKSRFKKILTKISSISLRQYVIVSIVYLFFIIIAYRYLPLTYYFHDEWRQLAQIMMHGLGYGITNYSFIELLFGQGRPFGTIINNIFFYYLPFQVYPFVIFSLVVHFINSILIFRITNHILKKFFPALFAGLFFAVSFRHEQTLSWVAASVQLIGSLTFLLICIDALLSFLEKRTKRNVFISVCSFYVAYLFKPNVIFFPVFLILLIMAKQIVTKNVKKRFFWISFFTMFLGIFLTFRYFGSYTTNTLGFSGASVVLKQVVNSLYYPLVTLGQYVLPYRFIYKAAEWILMLWYPFMNTGGNIESLLHFPLSDMVSLFVSATLFSLIFYVANRYKRYCYWIYIGLLYYIISFLPIALHLIHRYDTQIETRYLYTTTPAVGFLLACCLSYGLDVIHKKWRSIAKLFQLLIIVACIVFLLKEATITQREVRVSAYEGESMTKFITSLRKLLPKLPSKSILLIEGNKNYYFDNNTMPFKLGGGYVLSVLYYSDGVIPKKALVDEPFIQFGTQGIIQDQNKTFGYYWNREDLKQEYIRNRSFSLDQIRAYSYIGDTNMISDISEEIKNYLLTL